MSKKKVWLTPYVLWRAKMSAYILFGLGLVLLVSGAVNGSVGLAVTGPIFAGVAGLALLGFARFLTDMAEGWADTGDEAGETTGQRAD
ncbi:hypothetical protein [Spirillospora sp. CA-294931]|uniref:hypothetical protein n=1 Tax=Spirillospora sp. CA-294931 TaxID=3240042 RepID=UPI003D8B5902